MTVTNVYFDTWAWLEYHGGSEVGRRLERKYLRGQRYRVHTSVLSLAEVSAKLAERGEEPRIRRTVARILGKARVDAVTAEIAAAAGPLRKHLRRRHPDVGLVDAIILASARAAGAPLISGDPAFAGEPDVRAQ